MVEATLLWSVVAVPVAECILPAGGSDQVVTAWLRLPCSTK